MKDNSINAVVKRKLNELGFTNCNDIPYGYINVCDSWYCNEPIKDFITGKRYRVRSMSSTG